MARLSALVLVLLAGCTPVRYEPVDPVSFQSGAPRLVTFDLLAREAASMGYLMDYADPMRGVFQVHSRTMGRPPRRARRGPTRGVLRSNLFVVEVGDGQVRISAIGRHVQPDGAMHPTLAGEFEQFASVMRERASALGATFSTIPTPPSSYGAVPPPQGYGAPPGQQQPAPMQPAPQPPPSLGRSLAPPR